MHWNHTECYNSCNSQWLQLLDFDICIYSQSKVFQNSICCNVHDNQITLYNRSNADLIKYLLFLMNPIHNAIDTIFSLFSVDWYL